MTERPPERKLIARFKACGNTQNDSVGSLSSHPIERRFKIEKVIFNQGGSRNNRVLVLSEYTNGGYAPLEQWQPSHFEDYENQEQNAITAAEKQIEFYLEQEYEWSIETFSQTPPFIQDGE